MHTRHTTLLPSQVGFTSGGRPVAVKCVATGTMTSRQECEAVIPGIPIIGTRAGTTLSAITLNRNCSTTSDTAADYGHFLFCCDGEMAKPGSRPPQTPYKCTLACWLIIQSYPIPFCNTGHLLYVSSYGLLAYERPPFSPFSLFI